MGRFLILCLISIASFGDVSKADFTRINEHLENSLGVLQGLYDNVTASVHQLQEHIRTLQKELYDEEGVIENNCTSLSQCYTSTGIVCTGNKYQCDATNNFATGSAGDMTCDCASGYAMQKVTCKKVIDQLCASTSECYSSAGIVCTDGKCQCDTRNHFAIGAAGNTSCACDAIGYFMQNDECKKVIDETCNSTSECSSSTGIICTGDKCQCDTTKHFATGRAGDTSCECPPRLYLIDGSCKCNATGYFEQNGTCKKVVEETCNSSSQCSSSIGIACIGGNCQCDTTKHFAKGIAGDTSCECATGLSLRNGTCTCNAPGHFARNGVCKKYMEEDCESASECSSSPGVVCTGFRCHCDTVNHFETGRKGDTSCECVHGFSLRNGTCIADGKKLGQSCNVTSECYINAGIVCTGGVCQCDGTKYFATGLAFGTTCDCEPEYSLLDGACYSNPTSCDGIKKDYGKSGVYTLQVGDKYIKVYCEQKTDKGGWIVIQRRQDGSEDFYRNWKQYEDGFGNLNGEFWLGLANLHQLTKSQDVKLRVDLKDTSFSKTYAVYNSFSISGPEDNYILNVGGYRGNAGDILSPYNKMKFSTYDKDNDINRIVNMAQTYRGGWWYTIFPLLSDLNSPYPEGNFRHPDRLERNKFEKNHSIYQHSRQFIFVEMKIK